MTPGETAGRGASTATLVACAMFVGAVSVFAPGLSAAPASESVQWELATATCDDGVEDQDGDPCPPHKFHTATVLDDGSVLFVGGVDAPRATTLYDEGRWTVRQPTTSNRARGFTATLLADGRVLVVGGNGQDNAVATAELYDPAEGTLGSWAETEPPLFNVKFSDLGVALGTLYGHTATRLDGPRCAHPDAHARCGDVLIAGGDGGDRRAQLFRPGDADGDRADQWIATSPMRQPRQWATATLLLDGRVLVVGGDARQECDTETRGAFSQLCEVEGKTAEIYDPHSGEWTDAENLPEPVTTFDEVHGDDGPADHAAALLPDGRVLVTGGVTRDEHGSVTRNSTQALVYDPDTDPDTDPWTATPMPRERGRGHTATSLEDGRVAVTGGAGADSAVDVFDPATDAWESGGQIPGMNVARSNHTATVLAEELLVVGGVDPENTEAPAIESYEVLRNFARPSIAAMTPRSGPTFGGTRVKITGSGFDADGLSVAFGATPAISVDVESRTSLTVVAPPHPEGTVDVTVTSVVAGESRRSVSSPGGPQAFTYVPAIGGWSPAAEPAFDRRGHTATLLSGARCARAAPPTCGYLLVAGGTDDDALPAELFDPATGAWHDTGPVPTPHVNATATLLDGDACAGSDAGTNTPEWCGKVLVAGGQARSGSPSAGLDTAHIYDPATGTWSSTGQLLQARTNHAAALLPDGRVVVVGGDTVVGTLPHRLDTVEVYDPRSGQWSLTGRLRQGRSHHTATALGPTRVLVAGGFIEEGSATATTEIVEAATASTSSEGPPLRFSRGHHTLSVLGDGSLLVAGGLGDGRVVREVERLAASAVAPGAQWERAGTLTHGRSRHSATVLENGDLLVAGGEASDEKGEMESTEVFDVRQATWKLGLQMLASRSGHTATLVTGPPCGAPGALYRCGSVVAVGGASRPPATEILDPSQPSVPTIARVDPPAGPTFGGTEVTIEGVGFFGQQVSVRFGDVSIPPSDIRGVAEDRLTVVAPTAPQGTVDVRVTVDGRVSLPSSAARYTYASGIWKAPEKLEIDREPDTGCTPRVAHSVTALADGRVLLAGGTPNFPVPGRDPLVPVNPFTAASKGAATPFKSAELYVPSGPDAGTCVPLPPMSTERFHHSATLLGDGSVLVAGGQDAHGAALSSAERLFPPTGSPGSTWRWEAGELARARFSHTATPLPDGRVLIAGGSQFEEFRGQATASTEFYNPNTDPPEWSPGPDMADERVNHVATRLPDGNVLISGGLGPPAAVPRAGADARVDLCRTRDPTDTTVTEHVDGVSADICSSAAVALRSVERFNSKTGQFEQVAPMAVARFDHTASVLDGDECAGGSRPAWCGTVLVAGGGSGGGALRSAEVFEPLPGTWTPTASLVHAREGHIAVTLHGGRVLVAGSGPSFPGDPIEPSASAETYLAARRAWVLTSPMADARAGHGAALLPDGDVLVAGGYDAPAANSEEGKAQVIDMAEPAVEVYTPAPLVTGVSPRAVPAGRATSVSVSGYGLARATSASVDGVEVAAGSLAPRGDTEATVVVPARDPGHAGLALVGPGGTSATAPPHLAARVTYLGTPAPVGSLTATPGGDAEVVLGFVPALASAGRPDLGVATDYEVRQTTDGGAGSEERVLCEGLCRSLAPQADGVVRVRVTDLGPGTYHYAVRPVNAAGVAGPPALASVTLGGSAARCPAAAAPGAGQLVYPGRQYSLVGLPAGTVVAADSPLYSWFDQGAGGAYSAEPGATPVTGGRGYWAWFSCPRVVTLPGAGAASGSQVERMALGGYRASMVGNPSGVGAATVTGHDFAARWDPTANDGAGGYWLSGYRVPEALGVGEGIWVFAYGPTVIELAGH